MNECDDKKHDCPKMLLDKLESVIDDEITTLLSGNAHEHLLELANTKHAIVETIKSQRGNFLDQAAAEKMRSISQKNKRFGHMLSNLSSMISEITGHVYERNYSPSGNAKQKSETGTLLNISA